MTTFNDGVRAGMEKAAASIEELQAAYRRINPIRASRSMSRDEMGHSPMFMPTDKQSLHERINAYKTFKDAKKRSGVYHVPTKDLNKHFAEAIKDSSKYNSSSLDGRIFTSKGGLSKLLGINRDVIQSNKALVKSLKPGEKLLNNPALSGAGRKLGPSAQKAVNISGGLHEAFERGIKKHQVSAIGSHRSPKVLFDEHNMLTKMTGKGSAGARDAFRVMRHEAGETQIIRDVVKKSYGKRGWDYIKQHGYTKAMKKDLLRRFRAPDLDLALKVMKSRM